MTKSPDQLEAENTRLREGLDLIVQRIAMIRRPNGTTKVLDRIAVAALTGDDIQAAAARLKEVA